MVARGRQLNREFDVKGTYFIRVVGPLIAAAAGIVVAANYYLDLGLFGERAKLVALLYMGLVVLYIARYSPFTGGVRSTGSADDSDDRR